MANQRFTPKNQKKTHYKSKKQLKIIYKNILSQYYQCIPLLLLFGGTVTTCLASIRNEFNKATNLEENLFRIASSHDDPTNVQFIRPMGGAKVGLNSG